VVHLFPPSLNELGRFPRPPRDLWGTLFAGAYPRIHDRGIPPARWLADYVTTYLERDVRQVLNVGDLSAFTTFLRLCAGRTAQELNLSALGGDAGVTHNTVRAWLSVLEASFICHRLPAWHPNVRKQLVKAPKLHFFDAGLVCHLLGITTPEQLRHHPSRGAVFESWVVAEVYKAHAHRGLVPRMFHFRESRGVEVDLVLEHADQVVLTEVKSGATVAADFFRPAGRLAPLIARGGRDVESRVVYGGEASQRRSAVTVVPWHRVAAARWVA
jgi:hypothetical protein